MRLLSALSRPRARLWWLLAFLLLVGLPSLASGLALDDLLLLEHLSAGGSPITAFQLGPQSVEGIDAWREAGLYPWWVSDTLRVNFFRPLSALTHALDVALWPGQPWLMHLQSLLWYALLVTALGALYRRLVAAMPASERPQPWVLAGLALLLYAFDDAHAINVAWIAARNSIIGALFGVLALLAFVRARVDHWRPGRVLGPLCLALGLLAAEATVAVLGYILAFALTLDPAPSLRARARALLPYALVLIAWIVLYRALGHGAAGCGLYSDPFADPLGFVGAAIGRGALLLAAQLGAPIVVDLLAYVPGIEALSAGAALLGIALTALLLRPQLRRSPLCRFFALGMLLAALSHGTTVPQERYLLLIGIGGAGLVALVLVDLASSARSSKVARLLGWSWLILHVALPPLLALPRSFGVASLHRAVETAAAELATDENPQHVILLNAPGDVFALYAPVLRRASGAQDPGITLLYAGVGSPELTREDATTLRMHVPPGWFAAPGDRLMRDSDDPLTRGSTITLQRQGFRIEAEVLSLGAAGQPEVVAFRLPRGVDDPTLRWMVWEEGRPRPWTPPKVGEQRVLQPASWDFSGE